MDAQTHNSCWDEIDGILVVNMDTSPARYASFMEHTGCRFPAGKVTRLSAVAGRMLPDYGKAPWFTDNTGERAPFWGGTAGCALSHRKAIAYAQSQGWRNVLILEDDAAYDAVSGAEALLSRALRQLQGDYMLYLGFNRPTPYGSKCMDGEGCSLWKIEGALATHAYLLPASMYDRLLACLPTESNVWDWLSRYRAVDVFYRDFVSSMAGVKQYAILPVMFCQSDEKSDISGAESSGESYTCREYPRRYTTLAGLCHWLASPLRRLKIKCNSIRTHVRACRGGLPGPRKRKKK